MVSVKIKKIKKVLDIKLNNPKPVDGPFYNYVCFTNDNIKITGQKYGENKLFVFCDLKSLLISFSLKNLVLEINLKKKIKYMVH